MSSAPVFPRTSLFAKSYQSQGVERVCASAKAAGFDGIDAIVRPGFWCEPQNVQKTLPAFASTARRAGLQVPVAIIPQTAAELAADPSILDVLAGEDIPEFRFGYFRQQLEAPRSRITEAREALTRLAGECVRRRLRGWLQLHHGTLHASPSGAWLLLEGIPAEAIGVQLDPGNQSHEGFEQWPRSIRLLGKHLAAVGIKDTRPERSPHGKWTRPWAPLDEGATKWDELIRALKEAEFSGTFDFQPHYLPDDPERSWTWLHRDLQFIRSHCACPPRPSQPQ